MQRKKNGGSVFEFGTRWCVTFLLSYLYMYIYIYFFFFIVIEQEDHDDFSYIGSQAEEDQQHSISLDGQLSQGGDDGDSAGIHQECLDVMLCLCNAAAQICKTSFQELKETIETLVEIWCSPKYSKYSDILERLKYLYGNGDLTLGSQRNKKYTVLLVAIRNRVKIFLTQIDAHEQKHQGLNYNSIDIVQSLVGSQLAQEDEISEVADNNNRNCSVVYKDYRGGQFTKEDCLKLKGDIARVTSSVQNGITILEKMARMFYAACPEKSPFALAKIDEVFGNDDQAPLQKKDPTPIQLLMCRLTQQFNDRHLCKQGKNVYEPIYIQGTDSEGNVINHFTHAFRFYCTLIEFVYAACDEADENNLIFLQLTSKSNGAQDCANWLENTRCVKTLYKQRDRFAFRNGMLDGEKGQFFLYKNLNYSALSHPERACARFFDEDFPVEIAVQYTTSINRETTVLGKAMQAMAVPTPNIDKILVDQDFDAQTRMWIYAFIGRIIVFPKDDRWEVGLFFQGRGGTGKSTLLNIIRSMWEEIDQGILDNKVDPRYPIAHAWDKFIMIALEVGKGFSLDLALMKSLVSREPIALRQKYMTDRTVEPDLPLLFAGNVIPTNWEDQSNSLSRRMIPIIHENPVDKDTTLEKRIRETEFSIFIFKCINIYLSIKQMVGNQDLEKFLPPRILDMRRQMQGQINPMQTFIEDETEVELNPNATCSVKDFKKRLREFLRRQSGPSRDIQHLLQEHSISSLLQNYPGVRLINPKKRKRSSSSSSSSSSSVSSSSSYPPLADIQGADALGGEDSHLGAQYTSSYIVGLQLVERVSAMQ